jgi:hypothetical protein
MIENQPAMISVARMKVIVFFITMMTISNVYGCFKTPEYLSRPYIDVVQEADLIFLGKVVSISLAEEVSEESKIYQDLDELLKAASQYVNKNYVYQFKIKYLIKGENSSDYYYVYGDKPLLDDKENFDDHENDRFWISEGGRLRVGSDCSLNITFEIGSEYLIVKGKRDSYKSYERVNSNNDKWLFEVKELSN